jgi:hypothetical protein
MIDINKKYTTRDGRKVRIYSIGNEGVLSVHGAVAVNYIYDGKMIHDWNLCKWNYYGKYYTIGNSENDLIEVE